jgi:hypothetical protein
LAVHKHGRLFLALGEGLGPIESLLPIINCLPGLVLPFSISTAPFTFKAKPKVGVALLLAQVLDLGSVFYLWRVGFSEGLQATSKAPICHLICRDAAELTCLCLPISSLSQSQIGPFLISLVFLFLTDYSYDPGLKLIRLREAESEIRAPHFFRQVFGVTCGEVLSLLWHICASSARIKFPVHAWSLVSKDEV